MHRGSYILRDVAHDPAAQDRANDAPAMSRALTALGFTPVGMVKAVVSAPGFEKNYPAGINSADAEKVVEVMTSHDGLIFGVVERTVETPVISLQTMLENGVVVETTMRPNRAPQPPDKAGQSLLAQMGRLLFGDPPIWPRGNWPSAGYYVELVENQDARRLMDRHCARLKELQERFHTSVPSQSALDGYLAIRLRFQQVMRYRASWMLFLNVFIIAAILLAFFLIPRSMSLLDILFVLYASALGLLAIGLVNRLVVPELGPRPSPLKKLLEKVNKERGA